MKEEEPYVVSKTEWFLCIVLIAMIPLAMWGHTRGGTETTLNNRTMSQCGFNPGPGVGC